MIVRHADAGDAGDFSKSGQPDSARPLSSKGRQQIADAAKGLVKLLPSTNMIVSSPYVRAVQTAAELKDVYNPIAEEITSTLEPGARPETFEKWLQQHSRHGIVIAVGHEPNLGMLATWFVAGVLDARMDMKKSGACLIEFEGAARKGEGFLRWLMGPDALKALGQR